MRDDRSKPPSQCRRQGHKNGICRKFAYKTKAKARKAVKVQNGIGLLAPYHCPICKEYHLTSSRPYRH